MPAALANRGAVAGGSRSGPCGRFSGKAGRCFAGVKFGTPENRGSLAGGGIKQLNAS